MLFVNVFYVVRNEISVGFDKKNEKFPHRLPIVKIADFDNVMSIYMTLSKSAI